MFPQSRKILAEILAGVPDDEQAKIAGGNTARVYNYDVAKLTVPAEQPTPLPKCRIRASAQRLLRSGLAYVFADRCFRFGARADICTGFLHRLTP